MLLEGSCHCGAVRFALQSKTPSPYMYCYCSICRKTAGGGGFAINLGGEAETLAVRGRRHIRVYRARLADGGESPAERRFCGRCGSALWVWDPRWPALLHSFASAIDTPLPRPAERCHIMVDSAAGWVRIPSSRQDPRSPAIRTNRSRSGTVAETPMIPESGAPRRRQRQELCVREKGALVPWRSFSRLKTAKRMRSMEVRSWKLPMGRVRRRTSRNRRSMALVVRTRLCSARSLYRKHVGKSSRTSHRLATDGLGYRSSQRSAKRRVAESAVGRLGHS